MGFSVRLTGLNVLLAFLVAPVARAASLGPPVYIWQGSGLQYCCADQLSGAGSTGVSDADQDESRYAATSIALSHGGTVTANIGESGLAYDPGSGAHLYYALRLAGPQYGAPVAVKIQAQGEATSLSDNTDNLPMSGAVASFDFVDAWRTIDLSAAASAYTAANASIFSASDAFTINQVDTLYVGDTYLVEMSASASGHIMNLLTGPTPGGDVASALVDPLFTVIDAPGVTIEASDGITFGGAPEPAVWTLIMAGVGGVGMRLRNVRSKGAHA